MFVLKNGVGPGRGDPRLVVDVSQAWDLPDRGSVTPELIRRNAPWDVIFTQEPGQDGLRSFRVPLSLKETIEYEAVLQGGPPSPMPDAVNAGPDLMQRPVETPPCSRWRRPSVKSGPKLRLHSPRVTWPTRGRTGAAIPEHLGS